MARMNVLLEAESWLASYLPSAQRGSEYARKRIIQTAKEQRTNLENVKLFGHSGWCDVDEYEKSVSLLETIANQLEEVAE